MPWKEPDEIIAADGRPVTLEDTVRAMAATLQRLADVVTPGVRGIPGAQEIPELRIGRVPVSTVPTLLPGNQLRKAFTLYNIGPATVYLTAAAGDTAAVGFPLNMGGSLDIDARSNVWAQVSAGSAVLAYVEVSS